MFTVTLLYCAGSRENVDIFVYEVPNYYPRQPQLAHMSNEHPLLHQPTWHTPTTEPMKTIPHPHVFNLEQMLQERSYPRSGVDLTLTRNGSQNGDLPTTPISLSVRDTNKINSLPASALEIQAVELKTPVMKSLSPGLKSTSPGVKPLSPAISTSPGLIERQGSPKNTKKPPKRMDSILERLNSQPPQSETNTEKPNSELPNDKSTEKTIPPIQSVIVQPSNSVHDDNSNSSSILNVPTPTNLREEEVTSPYSNDDSLDSNKSRRKRKPSKTIRLTKESEKVPELCEDPLKLDVAVKDGTSTNVEAAEPTAVTESAKSGDEGIEPQRESSSSKSRDNSPAAKKTRRKTSSESETIAKIAAMVQEVVNESTVESQKEENPNKAVSVSVIRDTTTEMRTTSNPAENESSDKTNDKIEEDPLMMTAQDLPCTTIITPAQRKATNFVEVENKLEEMFAGIEECISTPKADPLEIDCEKMDDFINDSKDETDSKFDGPSTSQNDVSSTSNDLLAADKSSPKKARAAKKKLNSSYDKKKKGKKGKDFVKSKSAKKGKKSVNGKQIKVNVIKDIYAYDSGSNTSSVKSKGPFIQIKGPRDSPISVSIVNTPVEDDTEKKSSKSKKFHDDSEYRHKVRSKGLHCSTLSNKYDAQTKDVSWICVFCKRGPHSTDPNVLGPSSFSAQVLPPGDLFGPYVITSNCPEYERRLDDPYDKQFKSKKIARVLDASSSNVQTKVTGKKSKRKHSESDRSFSEMDVNDPNLGITETGDKTFEIWVHEDCVVWSPGVYLVGPKIIGLEEAVWTSCNVVCTRCGFKGANICCLKRGCTNVTHFGCAVASNWQLDSDNYTAMCITHKTV
ncbi:hypothetical protein AMK59_889 [Oryctes borbonicus]|uniref:PHD-type domain-containing protein n=1 Tax=Oryctes borbonicus TaxID=1629725 RepID=A0A0T6BC65_9SCAR|nr:hypothetical protein AMK59_889 [Oryctes borbonicus]